MKGRKDKTLVLVPVVDEYLRENSSWRIGIRRMSKDTGISVSKLRHVLQELEVRKFTIHGGARITYLNPYQKPGWKG